MDSWGGFEPDQGGGWLSTPKFSDLPGLCLWIRAGAIATGDGQGLGQVPDLSGRGNLLTVHGSVTYVAAGTPSGLPCFGFAGGYLQYNGALIAPGDSLVTLIAVLKLDSLTSTPEIFDVGLDHSTDLASYQFVVLPTGNMYSANFGSGNERYSADGAIVTGRWYVLAYEVSPGAFSGANPSFWRNGAALPSTQGAGTGTPAIQPTQARVGANLQVTPGQILTGKIAELAVVNGDIPQGALISLCAGLASTYGIT